MNPRMIILETLLVIEKEPGTGYAGITQVLDKYAYLDKRDRSFIKRVLEGCIERRIELDHIIDSKSRIKVSAMKPVIRAIMRMSVYQLKYMDSVPQSAVCNEAVKLAVKKGFATLKGFVNGVLRSIARDINDIKYPDPDTPEGMSVKYSCPVWLTEQLVNELGADIAGTVLGSSLKPSDLCIRVNLSKTTVKELESRFDDAGIKYDVSPYLPYALKLKDIDSVTGLPGFDEGLFQVQ
ncbi:MAG: 16S rRNA (cytosine(967)-C(5))-methyltransferase, partial [Lachnospiraceae bacterium]|nr:16S rRNA (cytosine(967)-C(5))-methyltransferase [Lachnospiraceae bacterium]